MDNHALIESLMGRTIVRVKIHDATFEWPEGEDRVWLFLDDGRVINFGGYGYDAYGATCDEIEVVDIPSCKKCGQEHRDRQTFPVEEWQRLKDPGLLLHSKYAYCTDDNSIGWREARG
jgi:hypothetical protein